MGNKRFNEFPFWGDENGGARWRWWVHSTVTATAPSVPLKATILMFEETVKQSTSAAGCRWELKLGLPCWGYPGPGPEGVHVRQWWRRGRRPSLRGAGLLRCGRTEGLPARGGTGPIPGLCPHSGP